MPVSDVCFPSTGSLEEDAQLKNLNHWEDENNLPPFSFFFFF